MDCRLLFIYSMGGGSTLTPSREFEKVSDGCAVNRSLLDGTTTDPEIENALNVRDLDGL